MAKSQNLNHQSFYAYLIERFDGDIKRADSFIEITEHTIPDVLNSYFGHLVAEIYDVSQYTRHQFCTP